LTRVRLVGEGLTSTTGNERRERESSKKENLQSQGGKDEQRGAELAGVCQGDGKAGNRGNLNQLWPRRKWERRKRDVATKEGEGRKIG